MPARRVAAQPIRVVSLWTYLQRHYGGSRKAMATHCHIPADKLSRWAAAGAVVAKQCIYLQASKFPESAFDSAERARILQHGGTGFPLNAYIRRHHKSQTAFAFVYDTHSQQISRWCQRDCLFIHEQVYRAHQHIKRVM